ncbi:MAG: hypothetical protein WC055_00255 [Melioribacteraceae bacterium]
MKIKEMFQKLLTFIKLLLADKEEIYYFLECKLTTEFPRSMMIPYNGIEFYVKDYSSNEFFIKKELKYFEHQLFIICEYFDFDKKEFLEKTFHEDFLRNRIKVLRMME